jgi:serine/threonine protein kinase
MESKGSKPENYKKIRELGKGACGKAYLVQCESTKEYAVIKQIDINSIKSREEREKVYQVRSKSIFSYFLILPHLTT